MIPARGRTSPEPSLDEPPRYDVPAEAGPQDRGDAPRTFRDEPAQSIPDDAFAPRGSQEAPPASGGSEEAPSAGSGVDAYRPVPQVRSPEIRPPADDGADSASPAETDTQDESEGVPAESLRDSEDASPAPPALPAGSVDSNVAWRAVPAATRTAFHATYSKPEVDRRIVIGSSPSNKGWMPKERSLRFASRK